MNKQMFESLESRYCKEYDELRRRIKGLDKPVPVVKSVATKSMLEALLEDDGDIVEKKSVKEEPYGKEVIKAVNYSFRSMRLDDISYEESEEIMRKIHEGEDVDDAHREFVEEHKKYVAEGKCRYRLIDQITDIEDLADVPRIGVFEGEDSLDKDYGVDDVVELGDARLTPYVKYESLPEEVQTILFDLSRQTGIICGEVKRGKCKDNVAELCDRNILMLRGNVRIYALGITRGYGDVAPVECSYGYRKIGHRYDVIRFSNGENYLYRFDDGHIFLPVSGSCHDIYFRQGGHFYSTRRHRLNVDGVSYCVRELPVGDDFYYCAGAFYRRNGKTSKKRKRTVKKSKLRYAVLYTADPIKELLASNGSDIRCLSRYMKLCGWYFDRRWMHGRLFSIKTICPRVCWGNECKCKYPARVHTSLVVTIFRDLCAENDKVPIVVDGVVVQYDPIYHGESRKVMALASTSEMIKKELGIDDFEVKKD